MCSTKAECIRKLRCLARAGRVQVWALWAHLQTELLRCLVRPGCRRSCCDSLRVYLRQVFCELRRYWAGKRDGSGSGRRLYALARYGTSDLRWIPGPIGGYGRRCARHRPPSMPTACGLMTDSCVATCSGRVLCVHISRDAPHSPHSRKVRRPFLANADVSPSAAVSATRFARRSHRCVLPAFTASPVVAVLPHRAVSCPDPQYLHCDRAGSVSGVFPVSFFWSGSSGCPVPARFPRALRLIGVPLGQERRHLAVSAPSIAHTP